MIDPALLPANTFLIDGPWSPNDANAAGYPVAICSNFPTAVQMKVGNTAAERALADWKPYQPIKWHRIAAGRPADRLAYVALKDAAGVVTNHTVAAPWSFPTRWASYSYRQSIGDHVFYPATEELSGGPNNEPYSWSDDSRWEYDTPNGSTLVLITEFDWGGPSERDMAGYMNFRLRGDNFQTGDGRLYLWMLGWDDISSDCRYYKYDAGAAALYVGDGEWGSLNTMLCSGLVGWERSHGVGALDFHRIKSWGIEVRYGPKPTGRLAISRDFIS